jgi:hypothetical protein
LGFYYARKFSSSALAGFLLFIGQMGLFLANLPV